MLSFGKYEIVEQIGQGGYGKVFKGWDPVLKRHVAIKTCAWDDPDLRRRFVREAELAAGLRHPHIVTVHDFGDEGGEPYLVQEFLDGEDLDDLVEGGEPLDVATKLSYLRQIGSGLGYAHERGVVHRDVKPSNIRVGRGGHISIMDFGIAKLVGSESRLTKTGIPIGTIRYMSPEQVEGGDVDGRSDVFSFGILAYELLSGSPPFDGDTIGNIFYKIVHVEPPHLGAVWPESPAGLEGLVHRCLEKDPAARYQTFAEVLDELDAVARRVGPAQRSRGRRGAAGGGRARAMRPYIGLVAAAAAVAVFGILNLARSSRSSPVDFGQPDSGSAPSAAVTDTGGAADAPAGTDPGVTTVSEEGGEAELASERANRPLSEGDEAGAGAISGGSAVRSGAGAGATATPADPEADAPARPLSGVLVLVYGDDPALARAAEDIILSGLSESGHEVSDAAGAQMRGAVGGGDFGSLGREAGAALVVSAELTSDAVPSVGGMYSGSALLSVRAYDVAAGRLILSESFGVGAGGIPGKLAGTPDAARSEAVSQAGHQAAARLRRDLPRGGAP